MSDVSNAPVIYIDQSVMLPENKQWTNRFEIQSESSDRIYIVAQNIKKRHWGCSCMAFKRYRHCKHLTALGIPCYEKPFEPKIIEQ